MCLSSVHRARLGLALAQVCAEGLEQLQGKPDLAVLFVSALYPAWEETLVAGVRDRLQAPVLLGGTGEAIIGTGREVEGEPCVSLWLARMAACSWFRCTCSSNAHPKVRVSWDGPIN